MFAKTAEKNFGSSQRLLLGNSVEKLVVVEAGAIVVFGCDSECFVLSSLLILLLLNCHPQAS